MQIKKYEKNNEQFFRVVVSRRVNGKVKTFKKSGLNSKAEAERCRQEFSRELDELARRYKNSLFHWESLVKDYGTSLAPKVAFSTKENRVSTLRAHTRQWSTIPIQEVTNEMVMSLLEGLDGKLKAGSIINLRKGLNGIFQLAIDRGYVARNPLNLIPPPRKPDERKLEAMTKSEIRQLIDEAYRRDITWASIWHLVYLTGLRSGEAYALQVSDVDFENRRLHVTKSFCSRQKMAKSTKTGECRTLPVSNELNALLTRLCLGKDKNAPLLPQLRSWRKGEAAKALKSFQRELEIRQTNFHSLRASFITHLLLAGVPMIKVQALAGHRDIKTTMKYVRLVGQDLVGATEALAQTSPKSPGPQQDAFADLPTLE